MFFFFFFTCLQSRQISLSQGTHRALSLGVLNVIIKWEFIVYHLSVESSADVMRGAIPPVPPYVIAWCL